ncbi:MAG TPA: alanine acetyltransferase [Pseudoxanthomonas sp.]|nr:alanine acetyltransferase [Pseudoxanthomonas sp.]
MSLSDDAALPWSAEQQEWLAALGYTVYASGSLPATAEQEPASALVQAPDSSITASAAPAPRPRAAPHMDDDAPPAMPAARPAARPRAAGARLPDRLHFALIRASGCNPNAEGAAEIFAQWPASSELRGNPAAKRALWPRLRALRRQAP